MEWYYIVLIAILVFFSVLLILIYKFREKIFNWAMATLLGIYIASPLDLIPDFLPFAGWADDIAAFIVMIGFIFRGLKMISNKKNIKKEKAVEANVISVTDG